MSGKDAVRRGQGRPVRSWGRPLLATTPVIQPDLAEAQAEAFEAAVLVLNGDDWSVAVGHGVVDRLARAFGCPQGAPAVVAVLKGAAGAGAALAALIAGGRACDLTCETAAGPLRLQGRATGALAWLRIEPATRPPGSPAEAERVRERLERVYDLTLSHLSDAVAIFGPDQRLIRFNDAFARLWDLEPAWLAGRPSEGEWLDRLRQLRRLSEADDYPAFKARELARARSAEASEGLWRLPTGRIVRVVGQPHPEGGLILIAGDVTDELQLETRFNQLVKVQQATLDKLTDAVAVFGADARLRLHNDAFQRLWSLPPQALHPAVRFDDLVDYCVAQVHDLQFWRLLKARITGLDPGLRAAASGELQTGDGRQIAWQSRPLPDGATLVGFADVSGARRVEHALAEREAALDAAERLKRDFIAAVSRELRTPLTTVVGYAELLDGAGAPLPERERGWIRSVRAAADALAASIEDILAIAELDAGERRLALAEIDLAELVQGAVGRWRARAAQAQVEILAQAAAGPVTMTADAAALKTVADHLIDNAVAHTPPGGRVVVGVERAHGQVSLTVADTGRGIPFDVQARLFERFPGLDGPGGGLGLALVKGLVELHGGWVSVESEPGRGARFTCHLPERAPGDV